MQEKAYSRKENHTIGKPLVVIDNISKQFPGNEFKSVEDISLTINEGELFALLGPSGCGKTTLMRMIAGFEMPTEGTISIDGVDMNDIPPYQRPVNIMFQSYALFPHMNVEHNIAFGLHQEKLPKDEINKRVAEALAMVKMTEFAHRKPRQLSGGQQQRVALARSLVKRPKLLLLDEPLGALDRKTREHTQMELINIQMMLGITFVMVTHDQEEAMAMANRIAVMKSGHIMQIGTPEEIYEYPKSRFVADFIGAINLFSGKIISGRDEKGFVTVRSEESGTDIRVQSTHDIPLSAPVWVAVRPEEMAITISAALPEENQISGKIIDIAFLGDKILYHVSLKNSTIVHVSVPTSARGNNAELVFGSEVVVSWYDTDGVILTD